MKIEIAESLFLSWLRHVRGCRLVQLNWKASKAWTAENTDRVQELYEKSSVEFSEMHGIDLFGKNNAVAQLLQQAEVDAIGVCELTERPTAIAVDVAFHEGGLNYGPKEKTISSVMKKMLRTLFVLECYFPGYSHEVIFATPKMQKAISVPLRDAMCGLETFCETHGLSAECRIIANEYFFDEIVEPVRCVSGDVADTSELFMRSMQLLGLSERSGKRGDDIQLDPPPETRVAAEMPIGKLVREEFARLFNENRLHSEDIANLCCAKFSKDTLGLRYPTLVEMTDPQARYDTAGHCRYYSQVFGQKYWLCNDWYERNRKRFLDWLRQVT